MSHAGKEYPRPSLTADVVLVTPGDRNALRVLMIRRKHDPFAGAWALPGGFVDPEETVAEAAARELEEETHVKGVFLEELGCFSKPGRDPRGWTVTVAYLALVSAEQVGSFAAGDDAAEAAFLDLTIQDEGRGFTLSQEGAPAGKLAFDHHDILTAAVRRLADHVAESAAKLLPDACPFEKISEMFEALLGKEIDPGLLKDKLRREGLLREVAAAGKAHYSLFFAPQCWPLRKAEEA